MLSSDAGISSMPSSMISNISETDQQCNTNNNNNNQQEIVIRNNLEKNMPMVVAPEHFTCQNDEPMENTHCYATPDVLEMKETQHESKVIWRIKGNVGYHFGLPQISND